METPPFLRRQGDPAEAPQRAAAPPLQPLAYAFARRTGVLLCGEDSSVLALSPSATPAAIAEARRIAGRPLKPRPLSAEAFDRLLSETYAMDGLSAAADAAASAPLADLAADTADLLDNDDAAPVIRLINAIVAQAVQQGASDIHMEPGDQGMVVRLRRDGVMEEAVRLKPELAPMVVSRVKVMARLDIAEKRLPQDGRISLQLGARPLDVRVSTLPARGGERVVMRILDQSAVALSLSDLGLDEATKARLVEALSQPNGMVLVTGPTGAGKTTTLYAALRLLNDGKRRLPVSILNLHHIISSASATASTMVSPVAVSAAIRSQFRKRRSSGRRRSKP